MSETPNLADLEWSHMPAYGEVSFTQLREAVAGATIGSRTARGPFPSDIYPGHQMVEGINYNSLNRIVSAFVRAALSRARGENPT